MRRFIIPEVSLFQKEFIKIEFNQEFMVQTGPVKELKNKKQEYQGNKFDWFTKYFISIICIGLLYIIWVISSSAKPALPENNN